MFRENQLLKRETETKQKQAITPERLQKGAEKVIEYFCKDFTVSGEENLKEIEEGKVKGNKFVIASSHFSNLDGPAAVKVFGKKLNLQITVDSRHFNLPAQRTMYQYAGQENFSPLDYKEEKGGVQFLIPIIFLI